MSEQSEMTESVDQPALAMASSELSQSVDGHKPRELDPSLTYTYTNVNESFFVVRSLWRGFGELKQALLKRTPAK